MGRILAWDQLRASGRAGAATADDLVVFARRDDWVEQLLQKATSMTQTTRQQWKEFVQASGSRQT